MTISRKLVLAFLALGIGVSALSLMAVRPLEGGLSEVGAFHMPALLTMRAVQTEINGAVQETFAFLTTGDPGQRAQFEEHLANADVLLADFKRVAKLDDPAEAAEAAIFDRIVANRAALERRAGTLFAAKASGESVPGGFFDGYEEVMESLTADLAEMIAIETLEVKQAQGIARATIRTAERWLMTIGIIAVTLSVVVGMFIAGRITKPLRTLQTAAVGLREGRASSVPVVGSDEVAALSRTFNEMAAEVVAARATLERRYRDLYECAPVGILELDETLLILAANPTGERMLETGDETPVVGRTLTELAPGIDPAIVLSSARAGEATDLEVVVVAGDVERNLAARFRPIAATHQGRARLMAIVEDVTERKCLERRQHLMVRELDHRVKNNLASVLALANQSIGDSTSLPEFRATFAGRLHAMARTHEALAANNWGGVDLDWTVERTLQPYADDERQRVRTHGPPIRLGAAMVSPLSLALHELATNSAKYGALSQKGTVEVRWTALDAQLHTLRWIERGGPPVVEPAELGTGLQLVTGLMHHELRGEVQLEFPRDGVCCTMRFPTRANGVATHEP